MHNTVLLVYHGDTSAERVSISTVSPLEVGETGKMRKALAGEGVLDILKVKIDDGTFFGGQNLVEWLCSRLKQELAFGAAVRNELKEERLASSRELDRLSENERNLKNDLRKKTVELEATERRLTNTTEALQSHKQLRMKEMQQHQGAAKEVSGLQSEVSSLMGRINLQADVTAAVEKECEALRSAVRVGRQAREIEEATFKKSLTETVKREEGMIRLKRRLHAMETEKGEWQERMTRVQREAGRLRAILWSHGINPVSVPGTSNKNTNPGKVVRVLPKAAPRGCPNGTEWRRGAKHQEKRRDKLDPLSHFGCGSGGGSIKISDGSENRGRGTIPFPSSSSSSGAVIGFRHRGSDADHQALHGWRHT